MVALSLLAPFDLYYAVLCLVSFVMSAGIVFLLAGIVVLLFGFLAAFGTEAPDRLFPWLSFLMIAFVFVTRGTILAGGGTASRMSKKVPN